jgi:hypothetical protein
MYILLLIQIRKDSSNQKFISCLSFLCRFHNGFDNDVNYVAYGCRTIYIYSLDHDDPYTTNVVFCKMRTYVLQSSSMMYRWCLTAACFDRCILTLTNARLRNFATVRIARRVIAVIIIVWLLLPAQALVLFNLRGNSCGILYSVAASLYFSCYTIITGSILPVSIMIVCTIFI